MPSLLSCSQLYLLHTAKCGGRRPFSTGAQATGSQHPTAGMLPFPDTIFAPFLGLGFSLHMDIKKPAVGEHGQGYPTSCILFPWEGWDPAVSQRTAVWRRSSHLSDAARLVPREDFPGFPAARLQAWRIIR